jgi:hypothetical protein
VDPLVERFVEAIVTTGIEIDPTLALMWRLLRDQQDLGPQQAGVADQVTARLDEYAGPGSAEFAGEGRLSPRHIR